MLRERYHVGVSYHVIFLSYFAFIQRRVLRLLHVNLSSFVLEHFCDASIHNMKLLIVVESYLNHLDALLNFVLEINKTSLQM